MTKSLRSRFLPLAVLCGLAVLSACTGSGDNLRHSSGNPVNPETDPGGQGMAGSRSTGANDRQSPGRP